MAGPAIIGLILATLGAPSPRVAARAPGGTLQEPRHEFHVTYARMGVEGSVVQVRLRFFRDDLAEALARFADVGGLVLAPDPRTDSLVTAYLAERFTVRAGVDIEGSEPLSGSVVSSGEEMDGNERIWWYVVQYQAPSAIRRVRVDARVLLELFGDQRNILRIQHFPSERQRTYYLTHGSSAAEFAIP